MTKICSKCKEEKDIDEFNLNSLKKDGHFNWCRKCVKKYRHTHKEEITIRRSQYNQTHKKEQTEKNAQYRKNHKEEITMRKAQYNHTHKEEITIRRAQYRKTHKKEITMRRAQYNQTHRKEQVEYELNRRRTNIQYKLKVSLRKRISKVLKGELKSKPALELLGCSIEHLKNYFESRFLSGMTWENYGLYGWHIDHIMPCASFDLTVPGQQKQCFHYTNLQPLWAKENLSKGAKIMVEATTT